MRTWKYREVDAKIAECRDALEQLEHEACWLIQHELADEERSVPYIERHNYVVARTRLRLAVWRWRRDSL